MKASLFALLFSKPGRVTVLILVAAWLTHSLQGAQTLVISEFAASNSKGLQDEDGDYSDWVEIFNPGVTPVNIGGWFLTDTAGEPTKWRFPETNVAPRGFLVVFASSKEPRGCRGPIAHEF